MEVNFNDDNISSDSGALLLVQAVNCLDIIKKSNQRDQRPEAKEKLRSLPYAFPPPLYRKSSLSSCEIHTETS